MWYHQCVQSGCRNLAFFVIYLYCVMLTVAMFLCSSFPWITSVQRGWQKSPLSTGLVGWNVFVCSCGFTQYKGWRSKNHHVYFMKCLQRIGALFCLFSVACVWWWMTWRDVTTVLRASSCSAQNVSQMSVLMLIFKLFLFSRCVLFIVLLG